jgi:pyridoxine kinase
MTDVISIQSQVVYGHVGNSAAVFPMQAKGLSVAAVPTALLSNHPHYPTMHGTILESDLVAGLLRGVEERGLIERARVILTGYLGSPENAQEVAAFVERALRRNPDLLYICDPVMGDDDLGIFVRDGLVDVFRDRLAPMAAIVTPNQFELELLSGLPARSRDALHEAMLSLAGRGTRGAAVTGCVLEDTPSGAIETVAWDMRELTRTAVGRLPIRPCGTGDLFAGLLVARLCAGRNLHEAAAAATQEIHAVLRRTQAENSGEMAIAGFPFARDAEFTA